MRCLQCGKEIPEGRKFCSSSCSAKYNNGRRSRSKWTEEQKGKVRGPRVDQVCRYCGQLTGKLVQLGKREGVCDCCRPYAGRLKFFNRLGISEGTLESRNLKLVDFLWTEYYVNKKSLPQIARDLGYRDHSIERIFEEQGWQRRSRSESQIESINQGRPVPKQPSSLRSKQTHHISWEGLKFWCRSSYEVRFAEMLDEQQIPYFIESSEARTKYFDPETGKERVAVPDFYLPKTNEIVEVKSSFTLGSLDTLKAKFEAYKQRGFFPKLWLNFEYVDLDALIIQRKDVTVLTLS